MNKSTLSVVMCNYNYGQYIGEALEAIFNQSCAPMEVIVVDDGSTDNSVPVIAEFAKVHPNLRFLRNAKNMGSLYSVNRALEVASGDYIYSAASDDKILPAFFEKSMGLLAQYPQAGLSCSDLIIIEGGDLSNKNLYWSKSPGYFAPAKVAEIFQRELFPPIVSQTVIVKRSSLVEAGGYMPKLRWACDSFAHQVISLRQGLCYIPEALVLMRVHASQYGSVMLREMRAERENIKNIIDVVMMPQYKDVLPSFKRAAPLSVYPWEALKVVISNKKYRSFFSVKLLRFGLFDRLIMRMLLRVLPIGVCRKIDNIYRSSVRSFCKLFGGS